MQRDATLRNAMQRKNSKKTPDTDYRYRLQRTDKDTENRLKITDKENRKREEKRESEREKHRICGKPQKQILEQMLDIWNEEVQSKITQGQKAILTEKRRELLTLRFIDEFAEDIRAWRYFCEIIGRSEFCLGKIEGKDWTIDLTWAIQSSDRVAKIVEGGFSGGKHPPKPPSCALPEFQDAWDDVLRRMAHHHGHAAIRSWFSNTVIIAAEDTPDGVILQLQCSRPFVRDWTEKHYLADLNRWWAQITTHDTRITAMELITEDKLCKK